MEDVQKNISNYLSKRKGGSLIFPSDFRGIGTDVAIKKALSRLTRQGKLRRATHGVYYVPRVDPVLGELHPGAEELAEMLAKKEKIRIRPAGAYALNKLGLSTQVPTRLVYITDGSSRRLTMGKQEIRFKATTPKKLATTGKISSLVIQALEELDVDRIDEHMAAKIRRLLLAEDARHLKHDLALATARVADYIVTLLNDKRYDGMA
jgi:predicted transcriptional regulator of viral defense system